jgi:hypothetical protein
MGPYFLQIYPTQYLFNCKDISYIL